MTEVTAQEIATWRYEPPYDVYDGSAAEVPVMLDPVNRYFAVQDDGALVGYICVGPDARVAGQRADPDVDCGVSEFATERPHFLTQRWVVVRGHFLLGKGKV